VTHGALSRTAALLALLALPGCGGRSPAVTPGPVAGISRATVDSLWGRAMREYSRGHWAKAITQFERVTLEVPGGDTLAIEARFRVAEAHFGMKNQLEAAREFRKVSDETPTAALAPVALLRAGDAYADLWTRPELDPTYGQTALATYQELLNRYPDSPVAARARQRIVGLEDRFAEKQYRAALYYFRLKAYDSAILYLKDVAATYPRAAITPTALLKLVAAYRALGYAEDLQETCAHLRRFHPTTPGLDLACQVPAGT
jgi:outer membrane protein assembly factor BamD